MTMLKYFLSATLIMTLYAAILYGLVVATTTPYLDIQSSITFTD